MNLLVQRDTYNSVCTLGRLYIDGVYECETLEDAKREGPKVYGQTAIPAGRYKLTIDYSNRFGIDMPHVLDVPDFTGIRIHPGNTSADTEGCILVGSGRLSQESLINSRIAYNRLFDKLVQARNAGEEMWITVMDGPDTNKVSEI